MNEEQLRNWFGNRGQDIDQDAKLNFKIIDQWLFIHNSDDEYDEVESYYLDSMFCEPIDGYPVKGFDWSEDSLTKKISELKKYVEDNTQ